MDRKVKILIGMIGAGAIGYYILNAGATEEGTAAGGGGGGAGKSPSPTKKEATAEGSSQTPLYTLNFAEPNFPQPQEIPYMDILNWEPTVETPSGDVIPERFYDYSKKRSTVPVSSVSLERQQDISRIQQQNETKKAQRASFARQTSRIEELVNERTGLNLTGSQIINERLGG